MLANYLKALGIHAFGQDFFCPEGQEAILIEKLTEAAHYTESRYYDAHGLCTVRQIVIYDRHLNSISCGARGVTGPGEGSCP